MMLKLYQNEELNSLTDDDARPDIRARGVWRLGQNAFFEILLTNANARSQKHLPISIILEKYEKEKKRAYVAELWMEHGTFTTLVLRLPCYTSTLHRK